MVVLEPEITPLKSAGPPSPLSMPNTSVLTLAALEWMTEPPPVRLLKVAVTLGSPQRSKLAPAEMFRFALLLVKFCEEPHPSWTLPAVMLKLDPEPMAKVCPPEPNCQTPPPVLEIV